MVQGAQFLTEDYVTTKILTLLGDGDKAEEMIQNRIADELSIDFEDDTEDEETEVQE